jgi:hypothetical protein
VSNIAHVAAVPVGRVLPIPANYLPEIVCHPDRSAGVVCAFPTLSSRSRNAGPDFFFRAVLWRVAPFPILSSRPERCAFFAPPHIVIPTGATAPFAVAQRGLCAPCASPGRRDLGTIIASCLLLRPHPHRRIVIPIPQRGTRFFLSRRFLARRAAQRGLCAPCASPGWRDLLFPFFSVPSALAFTPTRSGRYTFFRLCLSLLPRILSIPAP